MERIGGKGQLKCGANRSRPNFVGEGVTNLDPGPSQVLLFVPGRASDLKSKTLNYRKPHEQPSCPGINMPRFGLRI
jgi:hypothetical protein